MTNEMKRSKVPKRIVLLTVLWLVTLATACGPAPVTPTVPLPSPVPTLSVTETATGTPSGELEGVKSLQDIATIAKMVAQRTPMPTATPGPIEAFAEGIVSESGLADRSVLGLRAEDWIELGISALFVLVGSVLGIWLLFSLIRWAVRRTKARFDDDLLETIGRELKWLVVVLLTRLALLRLDLWTDEQRITLEDVTFVLILGILYVIALRMIGFAARRYRAHRVPASDWKRMDPILVTLTRVGYLLVSIVGLSIVLNHFGIDVTLTTATILFVGLVLVVGARAAIADAVAGFLILIDHPFRVGDDILIKELDTWGKVLEIGIRSTRINTRDNREVIIPNSLIGQSQVVNYSFPDPSLRLQIDIGVAYGTDIELVQQVIAEAVRGVEGVLSDRPVDVFFVAYGDSARQIRVRWWIGDVNDQYPILHRVNAALERALGETGFDMPFPTYNLNLKAEGENSGAVAQTLSGGRDSELRIGE